MRNRMVNSINKTVDEFQFLGADNIADGLLNDIPEIGKVSEMVCPNTGCAAHEPKRRNPDACFSCGHDNATINIIERFDRACELIDSLYKSGCLDLEREKLIQNWLKI